jgi:ABC-type multidrug transport system fused ATPase/permease subunit
MIKDFIQKIFKLVPKNFQKNLIGLFILNLIGNILEIFGISMLPLLALNILNPEYLFELTKNYELSFLYFLLNHEYSTIILFSFVGIFYFIKNVYLLFVVYFQRKLGMKILNSNRKKFYLNFLMNDFEFHLKKNPSSIISLINIDLPQACSLIELTLLIFRELLFLTFIIVTIVIINPYVTSVTFAVLILFLIIYFKIMYNKSVRRGEISLKNRVKNIKIVNETFDLIKEIKIYNKAKYFFKLFSEQIKLNEKQKLINTVYSSIPRFALEICFIVIIIIILSINFLLLNNELDLIPIITFFGASSIRVIPAFKLLASSINQFGYANASLSMVTSEMHNLNEKSFDEQKKNQKKICSKLKFDQRIKFKEVSYNFRSNSNKILNKLSFEILKGEKVGLVGSSGAGKSTILNLILGLLTPTDGKILIDDIDLKNILSNWQNNIGYVSQEVHLLNDSIKNNICLGLENSEINFDQLKKVTTETQLEEFLASHKNDYEFIINSKSMNISGGQKQRIGIARAIYKNPKILILDEATNSLDEENEKKIISNFLDNKELTVVLVAHRLSSLTKCDKIIYIQNGEVVEIGSYHSIVEKFKLI